MPATWRGSIYPIIICIVIITLSNSRAHNLKILFDPHNQPVPEDRILSFKLFFVSNPRILYKVLTNQVRLPFLSLSQPVSFASIFTTNSGHL